MIYSVINAHGRPMPVRVLSTGHIDVPYNLNTVAYFNFYVTRNLRTSELTHPTTSSVIYVFTMSVHIEDISISFFI
jgi:hypothetical protein